MSNCIILPCGHDSCAIPFPPGEKWRRGQCPRCWKYLNDSAFRHLYEEQAKHGPPISITAPVSSQHGLGNWVKRQLDRVGVTRERVDVIAEWLGAPCDCQERQEKLNALGSWATETKNHTIEEAKGLLYRILGKSPSSNQQGVTMATPGATLEPTQVPPPPVWAYGVTTVKSRRDSGVLQRTLSSLQAGGFPTPHLFVDGDNDQLGWEQAFPGCLVTTHFPRILPYGNWLLALMEIWIRNPHADRYALFQDDLVVYPSLREYLDKLRMPPMGYWNLYTAPDNERLHAANHAGKVGWYESNQRGLGAVAVVFSRDWCRGLLASNHMVNKPASPDRWFKWIDGGIIEATHILGGKEYCHMPSLVQHTGSESAIQAETPRLEKPHAPPTYASSFRGENFNALDLLGK